MFDKCITILFNQFFFQVLYVPTIRTIQCTSLYNTGYSYCKNKHERKFLHNDISKVYWGVYTWPPDWAQISVTLFLPNNIRIYILRIHTCYVRLTPAIVSKRTQLPTIHTCMVAYNSHVTHIVPACSQGDLCCFWLLNRTYKKCSLLCHPIRTQWDFIHHFRSRGRFKNAG